jgi:uncharacterized protein (TIGR03435 family)
MIILKVSFIILALSSIVVGQARPGPAFAAASVKRKTKFSPAPHIFKEDPGRIIYQPTTLGILIDRAYRINHFQLIGPEWLNTEYYDVVVALPEGTTKTEVPAMFQQLLAERFHVKVHWENRTTPVYALAVGKNGPKLTACKEEECPPSLNSHSPNGFSRVQAKTLAGLAAGLRTIEGRPVIDETGLGGFFNIAVPRQGYFASERNPDFESADPGGFPTVFKALEEVGLKLVPKQAPTSYLIVDNADKIPVEN